MFIEFVKNLTDWRRRPGFLIVGDHPSHRAKSLTRHVESLAGKLRFFFLYPYSTGLNSGESVWNHGKNNTVDRKIVHDVQALARLVAGELCNLKRMPQVVRSFFHAPETRHAAAM